MADEHKKDFSFISLIIISFILVLIDVANVYILNINFKSIDPTSLIYKVFLILLKFKKFVLLSNSFYIKLIALTILTIAILLASEKKKPYEKTKQFNQNLNYIYFGILGLLFLFDHYLLNSYSILYMITTIILYFGVGNYISNIKSYFKNNLLEDRFGKKYRRFKQTTKLIENKYSVNIKTGDGWINVINPFRGSLVMGTPGSGKSFAILLNAIYQHIYKGFSMVLYDFKFNDLTKFAYNAYVHFYDNYKIKPKFIIINFDDIEHTHRSNPLQPDLMTDFIDAVEAAKSILMAMNKSWGEKEGDFFVESPINFLSMCIWALKLKSDEINKEKLEVINLLEEKLNEELEHSKKLKIYEQIKTEKRKLKVYCSLPHVIQLVSLPYEELFPFLQTFKEDLSISNVLAPFSSALENEAFDQLEGQIASVRLGLSRLTSDTLYYVMTPGESENENISLDINNPLEPKIFCIGNNPQRQKVYSIAISLYLNTIIPLINKKNKLPCALIADELPTISFPPGSLDNLIATARSNKIAVWLGIQDYQQLIRDYSERNAKVIINTVGNIFTGMVTGDTAKTLSERFGKIKVKKDSFSVSKGVVTESFANEMQETIPGSDLSTLPQGWFAGQVADNFGEEIEQKFFYSNIVVDTEERKHFEKFEIPTIFDIDKKKVDKTALLKNNVKRVQKEILDLVNATLNN